MEHEGSASAYQHRHRDGFADFYHPGATEKMSYVRKKLLPWGAAAISSMAYGVVAGLTPMFLSGGQVFNFSSEYNSMLLAKNAAVCALFFFLSHLAKSPIPTPDDNDSPKT